MRVLMVDDEASFREAVTNALTAEGIEVATAADGATGLWLAIEQPFDVLLVDLLMPGINGYELCRRYRREGGEAPLLVLTAKQGELDEIEALESGADDFLSKPFSLAVLVARLRALVRRNTPGGQGPIEVGNLTVDLDRRSARVGGESLALTPRELEVLGQLCTPPGRLVSKTELFDRVWGYEASVSFNAIESVVGNLRRKLAEAGSSAGVETVRGGGYRLRP